MYVKVFDMSDYFKDRIRGKSFIKKLTKIDETKTNGYAFEGNLLSSWPGIQNWNVKEGDLILIYADAGSAKYHCPNVEIIVFKGVDNDQNPIFETITCVKGFDWARQILSNKEVMDEIKERLNKSQSSSN